MSEHGSRFWHAAFRLQYRILALLDPLVRTEWRRNGIGNIVDLEVARRAGSGTRSRLVGLLHANGRIYVGHPNGAVGWTRDLQAAAGGVAHYYNGTLWPFNATPLGVGSERDAVIRSTGQHPFPGNLVYRLGRGHVRRAGIFFRLTDRETAAQ